MNIKKLIILLIICIIFISSILFVIVKVNNKVDEDVILREDTRKEYEEYLKNSEFGKVNKLENQTTFYTVLSCINEYMQYNTQNDSKNIYNLLSKEYINKNGITIDNIAQKVQIYDVGTTFMVKEIYEYNNNENISTYFTYGKIIEDNFENEDPKQEKSNMVIQLDKSNRTFDIILNETKDESVIGVKTDLNKIQNNTVNIYKTPNISEQQMGLLYLNDYRDNMLKDIKKAYEQLDTDYRAKKYATSKEFEEYVNSTKEIMYIIGTKCVVEKIDGKNVYTVKDQYGKVYVFKESAIMEYTVQLDDYTIESKEYIEKYEKAKNKDKGIMNVDRFFEMLNMKDYKLAYSVLDEEFRANYFKTQADFEKYIKQYMFIYNNVKYKTYSDQIGSLIIYGITLTDATQEDSKEVNCNIIMKVLEDNKFVMSFEIVK